MIVVDTNVIAYLLIDGDKTAQAQQLYQKDNEWIVPALWRHEFLNVLSTFVRHGGGHLEGALALRESAVAMFEKRERNLKRGDALTLSVEKQISACDARFVVLALENQSKFVTEDQRL